MDANIVFFITFGVLIVGFGIPAIIHEIRERKK